MLAFTAIAGVSAVVGLDIFRRRESAHRRRMSGLDVNIHVNGIRGKSTVTRMLGGVLREAGMPAIAKTTGTHACVIDSAGGEHPIRRTGPANINEQYRFLAEWLDDDVTALVVECMAVKPKLQKTCQEKILRSPITVLTNVRLDHQDEMGDTLAEIAASLCTTVPDHGVVVTAERDPELTAIIAEHCAARGSRLIVAEASADSIGLAGQFDYRQFEENVAVVLAVAELLGIDHDVAVRGMLGAAPDPGTTRISHVSEGAGSSVRWVPMFAVNDWESTVQLFRGVVADDLPADCHRVIALNNRADRTERASMFVDLVAQDLAGEYDRVVLYGQIQDSVRRKLIAAGIDEEKIVDTLDLAHAGGRELLARATDGFDDEVAVFGMVNIHTDHAVEMERYVGELLARRASQTAAESVAAEPVAAELVREEVAA